jgi:CO/xanthine dehydrogenase FAD-binding subunit
MIPFDIEFLQPESIDEAVSLHVETSAQGKRPVYFGGGTQIVTGARRPNDDFDVAIDLKRIDELTVFEPETRRFGAALRLTDIGSQTAVPLLAESARGIADRTIRNSITLGGNICGQLPYREVVLPLLMFDASLTIAGPTGLRIVSAMEVFHKRLRLADHELLVSVEMPGDSGIEGYYRRRTKDARVDYPLVTLCMASVGKGIRFAVSGVYGYPFRSLEAERLLNTGNVVSALDAVSESIRDDHRGSAAYRRELLKLTLEEGLARLEAS